ncbi:hypothetical protein Ciccas_001382 [Cichlidogyrus casuarinus]|uniref:Uncharacterized protein n=1 Tax=Cichlidogyrus casuarinus TaxID=1844966 RepID=A0ABD2QKC9_9PLAT
MEQEREMLTVTACQSMPDLFSMAYSNSCTNVVSTSPDSSMTFTKKTNSKIKWLRKHQRFKQ